MGGRGEGGRAERGSEGKKWEGGEGVKGGRVVVRRREGGRDREKTKREGDRDRNGREVGS